MAPIQHTYGSDAPAVPNPEHILNPRDEPTTGLGDAPSPKSCGPILAATGKPGAILAIAGLTGFGLFLLQLRHWYAFAAELAFALLLLLVTALVIAHEHQKTRRAQDALTAMAQRNRALNEAAEARLLTRHVIDHSLIGIALYHADSGTCVIANAAIAAIVGADLERVKSLRFRDLESWKRSSLLRVAERVIQTGMPERTTEHLITTYSREIDVDCLFSRVTLGNEHHLLLMAEDVSERMSANMRLREEAERSQRYLDTVQTIVVSLDSQGTVTMLNRKGQEVLGWLPGQLEGHNWFDCCLPQPTGREVVFPSFQRMIQGELAPFESYDNPIVTKDGIERIIEWRNGLIKDNRGQIVGTISSGVDVTDKRAAEELNHRNFARLTLLLELQQKAHGSESDLLREALVASLRQTDSLLGCVICRSPATHRIEYTAVSWNEGHETTSRFVESLRDEPGPWNQVLESRRPWLCNLVTDGTRFDCCRTLGPAPPRRFLALPIIHRDEVVLLVGVANKATDYDETDTMQLNLLMESVWKLIEQRRAEQALDDANRQLQVAIQKAHEMAQAADAANRAKSTFLANMSHEIRTPMNAVLGFAELMQNDQNLTEAQRSNLATIQRSGSALLALINDVLEVSKIEAGHHALRPGSVSLQQLAEDLRQLFRAQAEEKGLEFSVEVAQDLPAAIVADEGKLRQILVNLVANAIKFTRRGGVSVRFGRDHERLLLVVADTGIGIESEAMVDIFSAFTQGKAGQLSQQGTGLGLTLCRMLARLHGGDIGVRSTLGKGSTFTAELPLKSAHMIPTGSAPPSTQPDRPVLAPGLRIRVLIAEDSQFIRSLLAQVLGPAGFELHWAEDGVVAVEEYQRLRPEFVLMDMRMPRLDGFAAVRQIRELEGSRRATIVGITGDAFDEDRELVLQSGCDEFMPKPFHLADLFAMFRRHQGVRFVETSGAARSSVAESVRTPQSVRNLPQQWWDSLDEATALGDIVRIQRLADDVATRSPNLAAQLRALVSRFDLRGITELIHRGSGQWLT